MTETTAQPQQDLIALFKSHPSVSKILFNDPEIHGVMPWVHHDDHFHIALRASVK